MIKSSTLNAEAVSSSSQCGKQDFEGKEGECNFFKKREDVFIQIVKSQGIARTRMLPDQEKEVSKNKQRTKNKNYKSSWSPLSSFGYSFGLGITRGTYGVGRGLLTCVTAPLSADFPTPMLYPTVQPSSQASRGGGSVANRNTKIKKTLSAIEFVNKEPNKTIKT